MKKTIAKNPADVVQHDSKELIVVNLGFQERKGN